MLKSVIKLNKGKLDLKNFYYAFAVFFAGCCYGILSTIVKLGYFAGLSTADVSSSQYGFGAVLAWIIYAFSKKDRVSFLLIFKVILIGIPFGLTGIFYYKALNYLDASLAIIFLFQFIWISTVFDIVFNKAVISKKQIVLIVVLIIGSIMAANALTHASDINLKGAFWGILTAFSFASFIFLSGFVGSSLKPTLKCALIATGGFLTICVVFPPAFILHFDTVLKVAPYGLFLGVFGVILPPLLLSIGMPKIGSSLGSVLVSSELPVAIIASCLVLNEKVSLIQWVGVALILFGIIFSNFEMEKKE